ncbi:HD domain-containing protein [Candidatus Nomurabacteria bacterium]|nr:HD domain-containing protein [Candidatus Nomurabacteria bacterium]
MGYTDREQKIIDHAYKKVRALFEAYPAPAHGLDHAERVAHWAKQIAIAEGEDVFMSELSAIMHDVGRASEFHDNPEKKRHHELSYDLLRVWFREDEVLKSLPDEAKMEILYGVRWHWNDVADDYMSAIILRDADKLDVFGQSGIKRLQEFCAFHPTLDIDTDLRFRYHCYYFVRTPKARGLIEKHKMMEPIDAYFQQRNRSAIVPCEL